MSNSTEQYRKVALRLKLRECSGDAFQEFFSALMEKRFASDFVRVRPFGRLGDKGCDGYLKSNGKVYQCYGALNGEGGKVGYLLSKMDEDFNKAKANLSTIMKEWHLVHNLVDGLPVDAVVALQKLEADNPDLTLGFLGIEAIESILLELPKDKQDELVGPVATDSEFHSLGFSEIKDVIDAVVAATDDFPFEDGAVQPVPVEKLDHNKLPACWRYLISAGWQNAKLVADYLDQHPEPMLGAKVANVFSEKYQYLKSQGLSPGKIMEELYVFSTGLGHVPSNKQVAVQALLAHLFESCDIFEKKPEDVGT